MCKLATRLRDVCRGYDAIIGLCGGIASGKSHARTCLASLGAVTLDADLLAHAVCRRGTPAYAAIVAAFTADKVLAPDAEIDRRKLGSIVFASPASLAQLNAIMWPAVKERVVEELNAAAAHAAAGPSPRIAVVEAALLIEAGWEKQMDEVWVTWVDEEEVVRRLWHRNGMSETDARARLAAQMPIADRLKHATVAIHTSGSKDETRKLIEGEWAALIRRVQGRLEGAGEGVTPTPSGGAGATSSATVCMGGHEGAR